MLSMPEVNKEKLQSLQKQLQRKFDFSDSADDRKTFFIGIADYVGVVQNSFELRAIVLSEILDKRNKLNKQIDDLTKKVVKEVTKTFEDVSDVIKSNKIEDQRVKNELADYKGFVEGKIQISGYGNYGTYLSDQVRDIILTIEASGYKEKVKDYGIYDQNGLRTGWKISSTEQKLDGLLAQRKEEKETSIWGAWEDLWWIYDVINNKYDRWDEISKKDDFMDKMNYSLLAGKVKEVLDDRGQANDYSPFNVKEYKRHLFRVNEVLQVKIEDLITKIPTESNFVLETDKITYDKPNHSLIIGKHSIKFNKDDSNQAELCKILFASKKSVNKSWETEEVLEGWDYPEDRIYDGNGKLLKENRLKAYQTAEKINTKIMKATEGKIIDLLVYSTKTVSINQKYRGWITF